MPSTVGNTAMTTFFDNFELAFVQRKEGLGLAGIHTFSLSRNVGVYQPGMYAKLLIISKERVTWLPY